MQGACRAAVLLQRDALETRLLVRDVRHTTDRGREHHSAQSTSVGKER